MSVSKIAQKFSSAWSGRISPSRVQTRVPIHMFGVEIAVQNTGTTPIPPKWRSGPLGSMGGKAKSKPEGFSPVCRQMWK